MNNINKKSFINSLEHKEKTLENKISTKSYKTPDKIANMRDFETLNKLSRCNFTYAKFVKLKDLAKNTIGESNDIFEIELSSILNLYKNIDDHIIELDKQISTIIKDLNPPTLSIPGIGVITCASIISEFGDISRFSLSEYLVTLMTYEQDISLLPKFSLAELTEYDIFEEGNCKLYPHLDEL